MDTSKLLSEVIEQADHMVKELEMLRAANRQLQDNLEGCRQEVSKTLEVLRSKEEEILQKQAFVEKLQMNLQDKEQEITRLRQEKSELARQKEEMIMEINLLRENYEKLKMDYHHLGQQLTEIKEEVERAQKTQKNKTGRLRKKPGSSQ